MRFKTQGVHGKVTATQSTHPESPRITIFSVLFCGSPAIVFYFRPFVQSKSLIPSPTKTQAESSPLHVTKIDPNTSHKNSVAIGVLSRSLWVVSRRRETQSRIGYELVEASPARRGSGRSGAERASREAARRISRFYRLPDYLRSPLLYCVVSRCAFRRLWKRKRAFGLIMGGKEANFVFV
jgi:hypothetical protein